MMKLRRFLRKIQGVTLILLFSLNSYAEEPAESAFILGNGTKNWIDVAGVTRNGSVLNFPEVQIDGNGWLVVHPFENGAPNGDKYVGEA